MERTIAKWWGLQIIILHIWYRTVVEKTQTYATAIWGHKLNRRSKKVLYRCQRHIALTIVRTYKTASVATRLFKVWFNPPTNTIRNSLLYGLKITQNSKYTQHYNPSHWLRQEQIPSRNTVVGTTPSRNCRTKVRTQCKWHYHIHRCYEIGVRPYGIDYRSIQNWTKNQHMLNTTKKVQQYFPNNATSQPYWKLPNGSTTR